MLLDIYKALGPLKSPLYIIMPVFIQHVTRMIALFKGAKMQTTVGVWHKTYSLRDVTL